MCARKPPQPSSEICSDILARFSSFYDCLVQVEAAPSLNSSHGRLKMLLVLGTPLAGEVNVSRRNQSSALWYSCKTQQCWRKGLLVVAVVG